MSRWRLLLLVLLAWWGYSQWQGRPVKAGPGVLAAEEPRQRSLSADPIRLGDYQVTPRASFDIEARILSRERYRSGREADLSPIDLALGWGRMSDSAVLDRISISQSGRFYFWQTQDAPIPLREIETHSANMHMIPASDSVRERLLALRQGQVIHLQGKLVEVAASDGWHWRSSLTREDTGAGACELIYVESVAVTR